MEGEWLLAREQDAGRGRQGREWVSSAGNFHGSTLVQLRADDPPAPSLSLAAGLALIEAVDVAISRQALMLKWPNDLMLAGRKLAGILLERSGDSVAVGFGLNLASTPQIEGRETAALASEMAPEAFAPLLAGSFARMLQLWRGSETSYLVRAWEQRAHPVGTAITVHVSKDEILNGRFGGLDRDGALRLIRDDGSVEVVRAADIFLG